jgi:hypothetical protein
MLFAKWRKPAIWLVICIFAGIFQVFPHLVDPVWQDESYTLLNFSSRGFFYPFTNYHLPNNHVLLSALLSGWSPGDAVSHLRLPLFFAFVASMALLAWTTVRNFGATAAIATTLLFALSTITANFALQLRGYGLSWLFVGLMLWALPAYAIHRKKGAGLLYSLAGSGLLALLPTNVIVYGVFVVWGWGLVFFSSWPIREKRKQWLLITLGPMAGLLAYIGIWSQVLAASGHGFSDWGKLALVAEFARTFFSEFWLLLPFVFAGCYFLLSEVRQGKKQAYIELALAFSLLVVPVLFLMVVKQAPFPRNLVPLLPVFCVVTGVVVAKGWQACTDVSFLRNVPLIAISAIATFTLKFLGPGCESVSDINRVSNLCRLYYQQDYQPEAVAQYILNHPVGRDSTIVTGYEGLYALGFLQVNYGLELHLENYRNYRPTSVKHGLPWLVTARDADLSQMLKQMNLDAFFYQQALDTGYFKIYIPATLPSR